MIKTGILIFEDILQLWFDDFFDNEREQFLIVLELIELISIEVIGHSAPVEFPACDPASLSMADRGKGLLNWLPTRSK